MKTKQLLATAMAACLFSLSVVASTVNECTPVGVQDSAKVEAKKSTTTTISASVSAKKNGTNPKVKVTVTKDKESEAAENETFSDTMDVAEVDTVLADENSQADYYDQDDFDEDDFDRADTRVMTMFDMFNQGKMFALIVILVIFLVPALVIVLIFYFYFRMRRERYRAEQAAYNNGMRYGEDRYYRPGKQSRNANVGEENAFVQDDDVYAQDDDAYAQDDATYNQDDRSQDSNVGMEPKRGKAAGAWQSVKRYFTEAYYDKSDWDNGIKKIAIGLGLMVIGWLWYAAFFTGIGALIFFIGVGRLFIARRDRSEVEFNSQRNRRRARGNRAAQDGQRRPDAQEAPSSADAQETPSEEVTSNSQQ